MFGKTMLKLHITRHFHAVQDFNPLGYFFDYAILPSKFAFYLQRKGAYPFRWSFSPPSVFQTIKTSYKILDEFPRIKKRLWGASLKSCAHMILAFSKTRLRKINNLERF